MNAAHFRKDKKLPAWVKYEKVVAYAETKVTHSWVAYPSSIDDCLELVEFAKIRGATICPRGAGYTFGDMILNDRQIIVVFGGMNRILDWNPDIGEMVVEPGVSLAQVIMSALPLNWAIPSCPGGSEVTVGGAISNNVHGKDSWENGNFGDHVVSLKLLTGEGQIILIDREKDRSLFNAVVAGMGLLGIILEAKLQLKKIPSPFVETSLIVTENLDDLVEKIERGKERYNFLAGWVDSFAQGRSLGRGFLSVGNWVEEKTPIAKSRLEKSLMIPNKIFGVLPKNITWFMLRPVFSKGFMKIMNMAQFSFFKSLDTMGRLRAKEMTFPEYNFMFNKLPGYPQVFRPHGFVEVQPIIPKKCGLEIVEKIFKLSQRYNYPSLMLGFKSHRLDDYLLSFSGEGYSFGINIHLRNRDHARLESFSKNLFDIIVDCGGKAYLAKDELLPYSIFQKMYPRYKEFLSIKKTLDPNQLFVSDLYRRLLQPIDPDLKTSERDLPSLATKGLV